MILTGANRFRVSLSPVTPIGNDGTVNPCQVRDTNKVDTVGRFVPRSRGRGTEGVTHLSGDLTLPGLHSAKE